MPDREVDPRSIWVIEADYPGMDQSRAPISVKRTDRGTEMVQSTGLDGRYTGALRPFPGFADESVHGIPSNGTTTFSVRDAQWAWTVSGSGTGEYYLSTLNSTGSNVAPFAQKPDTVVIDSTSRSEGTVGSLAVNEWDWGDNDSLGYDTLYVRITGDGDPDAQATDYINVTFDWTIENISLAKYAAIQKGLSRDSLRGIVYITGVGTSSVKVFFAYRDSSDGSTNTILLDRPFEWGDTHTTTGAEYDVTSLGRYIYIVASPALNEGASIPSGQDPPWNRAYWWDFKINDWDTFVTGFTLGGRILGTMPDYGVLVTRNQFTVPSGYSESTVAVELSSATVSGASFPAGLYTIGIDPISRKHNLRCGIRWHTFDFPGGDNTAMKVVTQVQYHLLPEAFTTFGFGTNFLSNKASTLQIGMSHVDGVRIYRSPVNNSGLVPHKYEPVNPLYIAESYLELGSISSSLTWEHHLESGGEFYSSDSGLIQQEKYDPFLDEWGAAPNMRRIVAYDGGLIGSTDIRELTTPNLLRDSYLYRPETLVWSSLIQDEPENFPVANQSPLNEGGETVLALEKAGDSVFAITTSGVTRMSRAGSTFGVNSTMEGLGGVSRFGQTGVGDRLFLLTRAGLREIDTATGQSRPVMAVQRILRGDWKATLDKVHIEYDGVAGCLVLLNTSLNECLIIWEETGALTQLVDCPWSFLTSGPEVRTDGPRRCFFIMSTGKIHVIDADRDMGKRTMCGTDSGETVNGTITSDSSDGTSLVDSGATFPTECVGFTMYMLSGARSGESATISTRVSGTSLTISGLSGKITTGDRYSIAPIIVKLTFPALEGSPGRTDTFSTKIIRNMGTSFGELSGEVTSSDPNRFITIGIRGDAQTILDSDTVALSATPDKMNVQVSFRGTRLFPTIETYGSNQDWELAEIIVRGIRSRSEAVSYQGL